MDTSFSKLYLLLLLSLYYLVLSSLSYEYIDNY